MVRIALYAGSFDPIHNGHIDAAKRAARLFDELVIGVYATPNKKLMFTAEERVELAKRALGNIPNIRVAAYTGMTVQYAREIGACAMIRGLRSLNDFDYELQLAFTNRDLDPDIETVTLYSESSMSYYSSSGLKEMIALGGDVRKMAPEFVAEAMKKKMGL